MEQAKHIRMKELVQILSQASKAYYAEDREIMSNFEYDKLYDELEALEQETGVILAGSPTITVGYGSVKELPKQAHEKKRRTTKKEARDYGNGQIKNNFLNWHFSKQAKTLLKF